MDNDRFAPREKFAHGGEGVCRPVPGESIGEDYRTNQIIVFLDVDDAVEVLGTDEPVVRPIFVVIQDGAWKMRQKSNGSLAIEAVMSANPHLLSRLPIIGCDLIEALMVGA